MNNRRNILVIMAVVVVLGAAAVAWPLRSVSAPRAPVAVDLPVSVTPPVQDQSSGIVVADLYAGVNNERTKVGLLPLVAHPLLEASACAKTDDMVAKNYWSHVAPDGTDPWHFFKRVGYAYTNAGENLAYGHASAADTVRDWMASESHRVNILGRYTQMGMCVRDKVQYQGGTHSVVVNHFGTPQP